MSVFTIQGCYLSYPDEGHGICKEANVLDMWSRIERFLCQGLALPAPPAVAPDLTKSSSVVVRWESL